MQKHQIKRKTKLVTSNRVGRGGKRGKTSGRGGKGQTARAGNKVRPEIRDMIKKLPKLRGRGKNQNKAFQIKPVVINLDAIESVFKANDKVNLRTLISAGIVSKFGNRVPEVKILGKGEITKAVKVSGCLVSKEAKSKIEKAGGSVA